MAALDSATTDQLVTPFTVAGGIDANGNVIPVDYEKLTRDFGATRFTKELLERFERVTGKKAHRFMRRGIVLSHRELGAILDRYEKGEPFYLYTGRGPSSASMHIGHATPFEFTKYLQEAFDCPLVIQLTDDEKFLYKEELTLEQVKKFAIENAKDIIGLGFDPKKTFIFRNIKYQSSCEEFNLNILRMSKRTTVNSIRGTFGFSLDKNTGLFDYCAKQSAPAFATSFPHIFGEDASKSRNIPCLIPCAIDQDPYFRQCRDNAPKLKYKRPSLIHSIFLPALQGAGSKMSASDDTTAIYLKDNPEQIRNKIHRKAFSGGQQFDEDQKRLGGRTAVDIPYQYLSFFLEDDDELKKLHDDYESGNINSFVMKTRCTEVMQEYVAAFQERRSKITDKTFEEFSTPRKLEYGLNPNPVKVEKKAEGQSAKTPVKKEMAREHAEAKEEKGHKKSMSIGRSKVEVEEKKEKGANGELKQHVKSMSMSKSN